VAVDYTIPDPSTLEVSLFGPGVGECVVVHLGNNEWMVIDSCRSGKQGPPVAIDYLQKLGVSPYKQIKVITISHWHDDHVSGMADLVQACPDATVCLSAALQKEEFSRTAFLFGESSGVVDIAYRDTSGLRELARVFETLCIRRENKTKNYVNWLKQGTLVLDNDRISVKAFSPSDEILGQAFMELKQYYDPGIKYRRVVPAPRQNNYSVVLHVKMGQREVLLGADLEEKNNLYCGWSAILNANNCRSQAQLFKVPHHGSETGYHPEVFDKLLRTDLVGIMTRFDRSKLPRDEDIQRLLAHHPNGLYCTTQPNTKPKARTQLVDKAMNAATVSRVAVRSVPGHIQCRIFADGRVDVKLDERAVQLHRQRLAG